MKTKRQCKEMVWSKKKWCETKRNDVKQKEMMWNKKKWRETKRNDEKQKEMTWSDSSWRFACGDVFLFQWVIQGKMDFFNPLTLLCAGGLQRRFWRQLIVWFGSEGEAAAVLNKDTQNLKSCSTSCNIRNYVDWMAMDIEWTYIFV